MKPDFKKLCVAIYDFENYINDYCQRFGCVNDVKGILDLHFNDVLCSSCYLHPYYTYSSNYLSTSIPKFYIGSPVLCLRCGKYDIEDSDVMLCSDCVDDCCGDEFLAECACCGAVYNENELIVLDDGDAVCSYCYANECFECSHCFGAYRNSEQKIDKTSGKPICIHCYEKIGGQE